MVVLLCGMIASGKGTFAELLAARGSIIVNDDGLVKALHNGDYTRYQKKYKYIYKSTEHTIIAATLMAGFDLVIDRPNFRRSTRQRYIGLAKAFDRPVVAVTFPKEDPLTHAERRFKSDNRGLPLEHWIQAATRHHAEWEDPQIEEGFDNIIPVAAATEMINSGHW